MPRIPIALAWLAVAACAPRFTPVAAVAPLQVASITGRWSNVYLITKADAALVIDSGSAVDCDELRAALRAEPRVRAVVITHAHADHAGCARVLQQAGAAVVLGAGDVATAARGTNDRLQPTGLAAALLASVFMFPFAPFTPELAVDHEVDLGAYGFPEVRVAPAPGHTPGELVAYLGDAVFVGDMLKGGQVLTHAPTEHLYQTDRAGDHAALAAVLAHGGVAALYPGHGGRLDAADVRAWLAGADTRGLRGAVALEADARGQTNAGSVGLRTRLVLGGAAGYAIGLDVRGGLADAPGDDRGVIDVAAYPVGLALRGPGGALVMATAGVGLGGVRGADATRALAELAAEVPVAGARLLARGGLAWRLGGAAYASEPGGVADEITALVGVRLFGDARWGAYTAGKGPFVAVTWSDVGGDQRVGLALGIELFSARATRP